MELASASPSLEREMMSSGIESQTSPAACEGDAWSYSMPTGLVYILTVWASHPTSWAVCVMGLCMLRNRYAEPVA